MASIVRMIDSGLPPIDPAARCHTCGVLGTVGRALRYCDEREIAHLQFCAACWLDASTALQAQWEAEDVADMREHGRRPEAPPLPSMGSTFETATWHGTDAFLRDYLLQLQQPDSTVTPERLREVADTCRAMAPDRVGPMPDRVARFIADYGTPDTPSEGR